MEQTFWIAQLLIFTMVIMKKIEQNDMQGLKAKNKIKDIIKHINNMILIKNVIVILKPITKSCCPRFDLRKYGHINKTLVCKYIYFWQFATINSHEYGPVT